MMLENALKRRLSGDVAHQADRRGIEISRDGDALFLASFNHPHDREVIVQRLATASVDVAHSGADLGVAVAVDFLFQKVDQTPVALKHGEHAKVGSSGGLGKERFDPCGEIEIGENMPKGTKGQSDSVQI